ncbi:FMN-linked oxidoreductase [Dentipellis sp. KUC8613]|nr:FMN-linked oxidoreductase [Dentipellis sp. KUC8613]
MSNPLFNPIRIGDITLAHRVVLAPLTRTRNTVTHVPTNLNVTYYEQRAREPGTLLITEGTIPAGRAGGFPHMPGIWNDEQEAAWKKVVDAVHARKSFIFMQLWAMGRSASPEALIASSPDPANPYPYISASGVPVGENTPRALTIPEIREYPVLFAACAERAIRAGFDGIEVHACNTCLLHEFLCSTTNLRTDEYGGSIENRARLTLEVVDAVVAVAGQKKTAVRLSPFFPDLGMKEEDDVLKPMYTYLVTELRTRYPQLAYIHSVEPHGSPLSDEIPRDEESLANKLGSANDFLRELWAPRPFIIAGGFGKKSAAGDVERNPSDLVAFGRHFIANPDLPRRIREDLPLTKYDRSTFYTFESPHGYIDYPFVDGPDAGSLAN